eukprot:706621_1
MSLAMWLLSYDLNNTGKDFRDTLYTRERNHNAMHYVLENSRRNLMPETAVFVNELRTGFGINDGLKKREKAIEIQQQLDVLQDELLGESILDMAVQWICILCDG